MTTILLKALTITGVDTVNLSSSLEQTKPKDLQQHGS